LNQRILPPSPAAGIKRLIPVVLRDHAANRRDLVPDLSLSNIYIIALEASPRSAREAQRKITDPVQDAVLQLQNP
jgi:hypothetical protein